MNTNTPFIEKIKLQGHFEDVHKAKDFAEVVFRVMRDLMTTEAADHIAEELHKEALPAEDHVPPKEIAELWQDTNPVVRSLSRERPPQQRDAETFLNEISQEANLPEGITIEDSVEAVFQALKAELSSERVEEVASFLPDRIRQLWEQV